MTAFHTLDQADLKGKRVLVRVDLNVPMTDGTVSDATRIEASAPTITEIRRQGRGASSCSPIFGRPKGRDPKGLAQGNRRGGCPHHRTPGRLRGRLPSARAAERAVNAMKPGGILCLENTRFHPGEEKNDKAFIARLASLADIWVNDAFSVAHRAHASTEGLGTRCPPSRGVPCRPSSTRSPRR